MKVIKRILLGILILIVLALVLALFAPKKFDAGSEIVINRPKQEVFEYVKYLKNQENFGAWYKMDPEAKRSYSGTDGTVGFAMEWDGEKIGQGRQVITNIENGERLESDLYFMGADEPAKGILALEAEGPGSTEVSWEVSGTTPYPFNLMNWFVDMDKDFHQGLAELKEILESRPETGSKAYLIDYFNQTAEKLRNSVTGLSEAQLNFKPAEDKWSVSQCLEHIVEAEKMIFGMTRSALEKPAEPDRKEEVSSTDQQLITGITDRSHKFNAPDALQPHGKYASAEEALAQLEATRDTILNYIEQSDTDDLRNHIIENPGGTTDGYQGLLFIAGHTARHTLQINEVKSDPQFPAN